MKSNESFSDSDVLMTIKLAKPLRTRANKTVNQLCKEYKDILKDGGKDEKDESLLWMFLYQLSKTEQKIPEPYAKLVKNNPELKKTVIFFKWLGKVYYMENNDEHFRGLKTYGEKAFWYLRTGKIKPFFTFLRDQNRDLSIATLAGAFSEIDYKTWRFNARNLAKTNQLPQEDKDLFMILSGDKETCTKYCHTFLDQLWASIICMLSSALAGDPINVNELTEAFPKPTNSFEHSIIEIFKKGTIDPIIFDAEVPLRFRVNASAVFSNCQPSLISEYIQPILEKGQAGVALLYCSLAKDEEDAIDLISGILAGLEKPEPQATKTIKDLKMPSNKAIEAAIDRIIDAKVDDFSGELTNEELISRKINALGWLEIISSDSSVTEKKVRKLLNRFAIDREFVGCDLLLKERKGALKNQFEVDSWEDLVKAELNPTVETLTAVVNFNGGWMNVKDRDENLMKSIVPFVVEQLYDLQMKNKNYEGALMVFAMAAYPQKNMCQYFDKKLSRKMLMNAKKAATLQFMESEKH